MRPIEGIVEEGIIRHFGFGFAENDFSAAGPLEHVTSSVDGEPTEHGDFVQMSSEPAQLIAETAARRDRPAEERKKKGVLKPGILWTIE